MKKNLIRLSILFISTIYLFACSDDEIVNPDEPVDVLDTIHMFNYRTDTIYQSLSPRFGLADTNNAFFPATTVGMYYYNELEYHNFNYTDPDFSPTICKAYDKENVFIGGQSNSGLTLSCKLCKFQGNTFINYSVPNDTNRSVEDVLPIGPNEIWFSTFYNVVYHFNSGSFQRYSIDSNFQNGQFFEQNNQLFLYANNYIGIDTNVNHTYKFDGSEFMIVDIDTTYPQHLNINNGLSYYLMKCGSDAIRTSNSGLHYFNGSKWTYLTNTPFYPLYLAGESRESMVCYGSNKETHTIEFFIRKNNQWYQENSTFPFNTSISYLGSGLHYSQGRYYMLYSYYANHILQLMPIN